MPSIPMCQPDGPKIRELIAARGYSVAEFSRKIGRPSVRHLWRVIGGEATGISYIRQIALGLRVTPGAISDWTGDDDLSETPDTQVA
jgi:transcriptional regulator with XRE-family HTH domain